MSALYRRIREYLARHYENQIVRRVLMGLACVVVFGVTYAMIYPAITLEKNAVCGMEEHEHTASCYESTLCCGLEEREGHTHSDDCYKTVKELVCSREEHEHSSDCYDAEGNLICGLEEHRHGDDCYEEKQ